MDLSEMTDSHLDNAIKYSERQERFIQVGLLKKEKKRRFFSAEETCRYCDGIMKRRQLYESPEVGFQFDKFAFICEQCGAQGPIHNGIH